MTRTIYLAVILLAGCATSVDVKPVQRGEEALTCAELVEQFAESQRMREEALAQRAQAGIDPARSRLMWPSLLGVDKRSVAEFEHARAAAEARSAQLARLMRDRRCPLPSGVVAIRT